MVKLDLTDWLVFFSITFLMFADTAWWMCGYPIYAAILYWETRMRKKYETLN